MLWWLLDIALVLLGLLVLVLGALGLWRHLKALTSAVGRATERVEAASAGLSRPEERRKSA